MPKAGDVVRIYEDPLTEKKLEGEAKLIEKISDDGEREYWLVEFTRGHERHPRWIKKETEHYISLKGGHPTLVERRPFCDRLEHFIEEEEKGIGEYEEFVGASAEYGFQLPPESLRIFNRIIEEQRSHVEMLKRIKESLCPS